MGNSLRCCLACVLPCGALDLIRVVHINGQVDQYNRQITAAEILSDNPNHVLSQPCPDPTATARNKVVVVSPESDLKRGQIYFLIPSPSDVILKKKKTITINQEGVTSDHQRSCGRRGRRSGRVGVSRQQLDSITEEDQ